jgi:hypothetical protein
MDTGSNTKSAIRLLVQKCRKQFMISENLMHNTKREYREAERKYVKLCLRDKTKEIIKFENLQ